jgi:hypothetical protein
MKNYSGLTYKMSRVDPATIPEESVKLNETKLEGLIKSFTDETNKDYKITSEFVHLFAWSMHFAGLCKYSRVQKKLEDKLDAWAKRKVFLAVQKERY